LSIYVPEFYSNTIGLSLAAVGFIFSTVRLAGIVFDQLIGGIMDRTRTRWGRFKPWLAIAAPLLCATIPAVMAMATAVMLWSYPLTAARHAEIRAQLPDRASRPDVRKDSQRGAVAGPPILSDRMVNSATEST